MPMEAVYEMMIGVIAMFNFIVKERSMLIFLSCLLFLNDCVFLYTFMIMKLLVGLFLCLLALSLGNKSWYNILSIFCMMMDVWFIENDLLMQKLKTMRRLFILCWRIWTMVVDDPISYGIKTLKIREMRNCLCFILTLKFILML